ncbi:expressed unknown protein [Seminavis robusta]|uniref:Uncharacterized protein n=1 Tax=Seminavis robusta TaxID=568900 RepID=A0A9N8DSG4_9STRA|nr:expressed unknown protein [Seminavis robusta]|eukprot:Sro338_g120790.1 n/a (294) ;mRNA; f:10087-10968
MEAMMSEAGTSIPSSWLERHDARADLRTILILLSLDATVMTAYVRKGLSPHMATYYGRLKIQAHILAGTSLILVGLVAVLGSSALLAVDTTMDSLKKFRAAVHVCQVSFGLLVVIAGVSSILLARHTSGHPGFNMCGYTLYALLWIYTGMHVLSDSFSLVQDDGMNDEVSAGHPVYESWVIGHAFLFCRIFTILLKPLEDVLGGKKMVYSVGTSIATLVPILLVFDWQEGTVIWAVSICACLVAQKMGLGVWHARSSKKGGLKREVALSEFARGEHHVATSLVKAVVSRKLSF